MNNDIIATDIDISGAYSVNGVPITDTTYTEGNNIEICNTDVITTESDLSDINSISSESTQNLTLNAGSFTTDTIIFKINNTTHATLSYTKFDLIGHMNLSTFNKYKINNLQIDSNDILYFQLV